MPGLPDSGSRPPLVVVWRVTERCDTACAFCAYDVTLRRARREADAAEVRRLGALIGGWARGRRALLSFLGGEPLLWGPLGEVVEALAGAVGLAVTTNGRALVEGRMPFIGALDELTVSIDGPPEVHDALRGRPGGRALLEALARVRRVGRRPWLRVNTVLMRQSVEHLPALVRLVAEAGADELTFNALGGRDRPEFYPGHALRREDVAHLTATIGEVQAEAASRGLVLSGSPAYLRRLRAWAEGQRLPVEDCGPGRDFWFVEMDRLAPCSFAPELGVAVEGLRSWEDLDAVEGRLAARREAGRPAVCGDCPSTQQHGKWR